MTGCRTFSATKSAVKKDSMYNTPSCFAVYVMNKALRWRKSVGGIDDLKRRIEEKARILYETVDRHPDFYKMQCE